MCLRPTANIFRLIPESDARTSARIDLELTVINTGPVMLTESEFMLSIAIKFIKENKGKINSIFLWWYIEDQVVTLYG